MSRTPITPVRIPAAIKAAALEWCEQHGIGLSELIVKALIAEIGQPELETAIPPKGRPKNAG